MFFFPLDSISYMVGGSNTGKKKEDSSISALFFCLGCMALSGMYGATHRLRSKQIPRPSIVVLIALAENEVTHAAIGTHFAVRLHYFTVVVDGV